MRSVVFRRSDDAFLGQEVQVEPARDEQHVLIRDGSFLPLRDVFAPRVGRGTSAVDGFSVICEDMTCRSYRRSDQVSCYFRRTFSAELNYELEVHVQTRFNIRC